MKQDETKVDVLAVMDQATRDCRDVGLQAQLHDAFAAIAELIEADREFKAANDALSKTHPQGEDAETMESMYAHRNRCRERREKALARVGGGK